MRKLTQKELFDISWAMDRDFRSIEEQDVTDKFIDKLARQLFNKSYDQLERDILRRNKRKSADI